MHTGKRSCRGILAEINKGNFKIMTSLIEKRNLDRQKLCNEITRSDLTMSNSASIRLSSDICFLGLNESFVAMNLDYKKWKT